MKAASFPNPSNCNFNKGSLFQMVLEALSIGIKQAPMPCLHVLRVKGDWFITINWVQDDWESP